MARIKFGARSRGAATHLYTRTADTYPLLFPHHRRPDYSPLATEPEWQDGFRGETPRQRYVHNARIDLIPLDDHTVTLIHVRYPRVWISTESLRNRQSDQPHHPTTGTDTVPAGPPVPIPERNLRTGELPDGFYMRDFTAYRVGDNYYMLTVDGRLFVAEPRGKDGLEISVVWLDPQRRLIGVVQDPARESVHVFGQFGRYVDGKRFVIRLGEEPKPRQYTRRVSAEAERNEAFREVHDCHRFVTPPDK